MKKILVMPLVAATFLLCGCNVNGGSSSSSGEDSSSSLISTSSSIHVHQYEEVLTPPTCTEEGYSTYTCSCGDSYIDEKVPPLGHDYVGIICARCGKAKEILDGEILEFGHYPQSLVKDESLLSSLSLIEEEGDGYIEYEGNEYFKTLGRGLNGYSSSSTYYFLVEPIEWKYYGGMLISEKIIDASSYYPDGDNERVIEGETVYSNNYAYSNIRAYLNGLNGSSYSVEDYSGKGFLDLAFSEIEKEAIKVTNVDNRASTTYSEPNPYASSNTDDKIFLLSYQNAKNPNYGYSEATSSSDTRVKKYSDFALFKGLDYYDSASGTGLWWLRSPYSYRPNRVSGIFTMGNLVDNYLVNFSYGIVPSLYLSI